MSTPQAKAPQEEDATTVVIANETPAAEGKPKRSAGQIFCCCCRRTTKCLLFVVFILVLVGVALYFLFPAVPTLQIGNLYIPQGIKGLQVTKSLPQIGQSPTNITIGILLSLASNVSIYSPAYINVGLRTVTMDVTLKNSTGQELPNVYATGKYSNLKIQSRDTTNVTFPVNVTYSTTALTGQADPLITTIQDACLSVPQKQLNGRVVVTLDLSSIAWLGIYPKIPFDVGVDCPDIATVQESLPANVTSVTTSAASPTSSPLL